MKGKTIKPLDDREYLDLAVGKDFLNRTQRALNTKKKLYKLNPFKIKKFWSSKGSLRG